MGAEEEIGKCKGKRFVDVFVQHNSKLDVVLAITPHWEYEKNEKAGKLHKLFFFKRPRD